MAWADMRAAGKGKRAKGVDQKGRKEMRTQDVEGQGKKGMRKETCVNKKKNRKENMVERQSLPRE